jgi:class 3 adenylate cyclase/tetratricopeptide (TPR) repeat protein
VDQAAATLQQQVSPVERISSVAGSAERRQLTVMFCDLVGSTSLSAHLDPEDLRDLIAAYRQCVTTAVARFDGFIARYLGDGVLVYFGYPRAHEDDAERAVRAGLATVESVSGLIGPTGIRLEVHVGIATGLVVAGEPIEAGGHQERDAIGETPNLAARLEAVAAPGEIVIADSTRRLLGSMFDYRPLGPLQLKGLPLPVEAWQVLGERTGIGRFEALHSAKQITLVGRQEEIQLLLRNWRHAKKGEGRVVLLMGEPGIGKSHVAESLLAGLEGEPHVCLRYYCSPHHTHSALYPYIAQIERAAGFGARSDVGDKLNRLESLLEPMAEAAPEGLALIAELLNVPANDRYRVVEVSPQQKREMTLAVLLAQLVSTAARSPALLIFEDAHWIDPTSFDLLGRIVERIVDLPVLAIITSRSGLLPAWVDRPHVTTLALSRLGRSEGASIIAGVTKAKSLPDVVTERILARADGVPLFVEELTRSMLQSGLLLETSDHYALQGPLPPLAVPMTLQDSLTARLDRLGSAKNVAQIASVIGREFPLRLLKGVCQLSDDAVTRDLERLISSGIVERGGGIESQSFVFKHALIRDAAYGSILRRQRRLLHSSLAGILETERGASSTVTDELIASHHENAGEERLAIAARRRGAESAISRGSQLEAANLLELAVAATAKLPLNDERRGLELELTMLLAVALSTAYSYAAPEVEMLLLRARELCADLGRHDVSFNIEFGLTFSNVVKDDLDRAEIFAAGLYEHAKHHIERPLVDAYLINGVVKVIRGRFEEASQLLHKAVELSDPEHDEPHLFSHGFNPGVYSRAYLAQCLAMMGRVRTSVDLISSTLASARIRASDPLHIYSYVSALVIAGRTYMLLGDVRAVDENSKELIEIAGRHRYAYFKNIGELQRSWTLTKESSMDLRRMGAQQMSAGLAALEKAGIGLGIRSFYSQLALAQIDLGEKAKALESVNKATGRHGLGSRSWDAEVQRVTGEVLKMLPAPDQARALECYSSALRIAREQGAGIFELRAALSCSRLLHDLGRHDEARALLTVSMPIVEEGTVEAFDVKQFFNQLPTDIEPARYPL